MAMLPLIADDQDLLPVLRAANDDMLRPLVGFITNDGKSRLASSLDALDVYTRNRNKPTAYADEIASEIQTFGGNSLVNLARGGQGVAYAEIVRDVADKLGVQHTLTSSVARIEQRILVKIVAKAWERMSVSERRALLESMGIAYGNTLPKALPVVALQAAVRASGFLAYQLAVVVANGVARAVLGRGLTFAANAALTRLLGILVGPVGWAITGAWTAIDLASPAYRVTVPCVVQVAAIRHEQACLSPTVA